MATENKNYAATDLERVKFTADSDTDNSVVQTFVVNQTTGETPTPVQLTQFVENRVQNDDLLAMLEQIKYELEKMNTYFSVITNVKL